MLNRRNFLKSAAAASGAVLASSRGLSSAQAAQDVGAKGPYKLKYAPVSTWFTDIPDFEDRLQRIYDEGFRAVENNGVKTWKQEDIRRYAKKLHQLGMEHGIFVANLGVSAGAGVVDPKQHPRFIEEVKKAIEVAKIVGNKFVTITTGNEIPRMLRGQMRVNVIEGLKKGGELLAKAGITGVIEPLNIKRDHPGYFLARSDEAYEVMKAVDNPHIKILFDIYHQQITEGNLIENIQQFWDEIGYFQFADVPGRHEPWTGEINYRNVFKAIYQMNKKTGRDLIVGMELGPTGGGETDAILKVFDAVRKADNFEV